MSQVYQGTQSDLGGAVKEETVLEDDLNVPEVFTLSPLSRTRMTAKVLQVRTPPFVYVFDGEAAEAEKG